MSKIVWDKVGERFYETGVDHGVLYPMVNGLYPKGVAWNGLISVSESPSGGEANANYADNIKYLNLMSAEEFGATVEAFTYPEEFAACDGSAVLTAGIMIESQKRQSFGMSYRSRIGTDEDDDYGYKIHLVYGAKASPSEKSRSTVNDSPEAIQFSWELTTTPVEIINPADQQPILNPITGKPFRPTAHLVIDSTKFDTTALKEKLAALEEILYGKDGGEGVEAVDPRLPLPGEIYTLLTAQG